MVYSEDDLAYYIRKKRIDTILKSFNTSKERTKELILKVMTNCINVAVKPSFYETIVELFERCESKDKECFQEILDTTLSYTVDFYDEAWKAKILIEGGAKGMKAYGCFEELLETPSEDSLRSLSKDDLGTFMIYASCRNHLVVKELLRLGVDVNYKDKLDNTASYIAIDSYNIGRYKKGAFDIYRMIKILNEYNADFHIFKNCRTAYSIATPEIKEHILK